MIIALAGISMSGKTSLAKHLHTRLGWPLLSFGSFIRKEAAKRGVGQDFPTLQSLGQTLVDDNPDTFVKRVFKHASIAPDANLIVDGLRHVEVLEAMRAYTAPSPTILVLVQVDQKTLAARHNAVGQDLEDVLAGAAEQQVQSELPDRADLVVSGLKPHEEVSSEIVSFATARGLLPSRFELKN